MCTDVQTTEHVQLFETLAGRETSAEVSNRVNFGSWAGRLTCPEKSWQLEYPMISGLVWKKRYGIQCPENIGPASIWSIQIFRASL